MMTTGTAGPREPIGRHAYKPAPSHQKTDHIVRQASTNPSSEPPSANSPNCAKTVRQPPSQLPRMLFKASACSRTSANQLTACIVVYGYGWNTEALSALLDEVTRHWRVDVERIHVTGFSMGGYGTWALGLQCPERFASLVPMCGGGEVEHAGLIAGVPQWCVSLLTSLRGWGMRGLRFVLRFGLIGFTMANWTRWCR